MNIQRSQSPTSVASFHNNGYLEESDFKATAANKYLDAAKSNPTGRLIVSRDGLDIVAAPRSFFGTFMEWLPTSNEQIAENKLILQRFKDDLSDQFGHQIAEFACSKLDSVERGGLNASKIQQVFHDATLFAEVLEKCGLFINHSIVANAAAVLAVDAERHAIQDCKHKYASATEAAAQRDEKRAVVNHLIDDYVKTKLLDPKCPEALALEKLKNLILPDNEGETLDHSAAPDLEVFEQAVATIPSDSRLAPERLVITKSKTQLMPALALTTGWTGKVFTLLAGRDEEHVKENRRTIEAFKNALVKKYGSKVADFAFPTADERMQEGSRLNAVTIRRTLEDAKKVSAFFSTIENAIEVALETRALSHRAEGIYRVADLRSKAASKNATEKSQLAQQAKREAEKAITKHLFFEDTPSSLTLAQADKLTRLCFEEAQERYKTAPSAPPAPIELVRAEAKLVSEVWSNNIPVATAVPSAPPYQVDSEEESASV